MNLRKLGDWLGEHFFGSSSREKYNYHINFCKEMSRNKQEFRKQYYLTQFSKVMGVYSKVYLTLVEACIMGIYSGSDRVIIEGVDTPFWKPIALAEFIRLLPTLYNCVAKTFMSIHRRSLHDSASHIQTIERLDRMQKELEREDEDWKRWE